MLGNKKTNKISANSMHYKRKSVTAWEFGAITFTLLGAFVLVAYLGLNLLVSYDAAPITPDLEVTPQAQDVNVTDDVTLTFNPDNALVSGDSLSVTIPVEYAGAASLTDSDIVVTGNNITSSSESAFTATGFTTTISSSAAVTDPITITIGGTNKLTTPNSAGNYEFALVASNGDTGSSIQSVGEANVVVVRALVPSTLSLVVRNADDTADLIPATCDLQTLDTFTISECEYRIKVASNASNGYQLVMRSDGGLSNGLYTFADAASGPLGELIQAGTELYGIQIDPGQTTGGTVLVENIFDTDIVANPDNVVNSNYTDAQGTVIYTTDGSNNPGATGDLTNTTLVRHKATIDAETPAGEYEQRIIYTVVANF